MLRLTGVCIPQLCIAVLLQSVFEFIRKFVTFFEGQNNGSFTVRYEFPNGVNIIVIPDVYITVALYGDLECEVSHVLYFMTTDCQTNTVKALLIIKLSKRQFTSQDITGFIHFFFTN